MSTAAMARAGGRAAQLAATLAPVGGVLAVAHEISARIGFRRDA